MGKYELTQGRRRQIYTEIDAELARAIWAYPGGFHSAHEGIAVIREEFEELWAHVKVKPGDRDHTAMRQEAIQIAAMAVRFILDVVEADHGV